VKEFHKVLETRDCCGLADAVFERVGDGVLVPSGYPEGVVSSERFPDGDFIGVDSLGFDDSPGNFSFWFFGVADDSSGAALCEFDGAHFPADCGKEEGACGCHFVVIL